MNLIELLKSCRYGVALTGAGISTPSGIPDFRSPTGLYSKYPENVFDIDYLYNNPEGFYRFCKEALIPMADAKPNVAHYLLAKLEQKGYIKAVITQNIDGLHQKAGNQNVIELHGSIYNYYCIKCLRRYTIDDVKNMLSKTSVPKCNCSGMIRPDIVFFGEQLPQKALSEAEYHSVNCDLMIVFGSSLLVYPAAQFPYIAKMNGSKLIIVNSGRTGLDHICDLKIEKELSTFANEFFSSGSDFLN